MAQSGYTPISLYHSTTAAAVPTNTNLVAGELALNIVDGKLYYKDNSNVVQLLAAKGGNGVTTFSAGTTGLTPNSATSGAVTLAGTLITSNGGTGLSSYTAGDMTYYTSGTALTKLNIGSNGQVLSVVAGAPAWTTLSGIAVTTISFGTTGLTPSTPTGGAVTVAGTLAVANGGTGVTTSTGTGSVVLSNAPTFTGNPIFNSTGAVTLPSGTTGQQPGSPVEGMIRYNNTTKQFEGYSQVSTIPGWYSVGGSAISNDTTTATNNYPLFVDTTSGTAQIVYTSNAKYLYKPSTGELTAQQIVANNGFFVNPNTLSSSYTLAADSNASTTGPFTIPSGLSVTVSSNSRWVVL